MIGIIGAMEEEVAALKSEMADAKVTEFASMTFYKGTLCGKDAVVVRSGIGKVNAAICAQILVDKIWRRYADQYRYCRIPGCKN
mgnify:FL=1